MLEKAIAISEELVAENPNIPDYAVSQVHIRLRLAETLRDHDPAGAEAALRKAMDLQSTLVRRFPGNSSYKFWMAILHEWLAGLHQEHGQLATARTELQQSVALLKETMDKDPKAEHVSGVLHHNYLSLANVLRRLGQDDAAAEALAKAQELHPGR
jgi:tetratricopeptide (TPR) repeat protein